MDQKTKQLKYGILFCKENNSHFLGIRVQLHVHYGDVQVGYIQVVKMGMYIYGIVSLDNVLTNLERVILIHIGLIQWH